MKIVKIVTISSMVFGFMGCGSDSSSTKDEAFQSAKTLKTFDREVNYLVDNEGKALYLFDNDTLNTSNCNAECQKRWPLFLGTDKNKHITIINESEGHLAYRQHPLYYFSNDITNEDIKGNHINDVWHLIIPYNLEEGNEVKLSEQKIKQTYLTDGNGIALYVYEGDENGKSNCYGACEIKWPIFYSDALGTLPAGTSQSDFGTIDRDPSLALEGQPLKQTTYKGKPLYYYVNELDAPFGVKCDWDGDVWHIVEIPQTNQ